MNLSFSVKWPERMGDLAGKPNFFIEKIWQGLSHVTGKDYELFAELYRRKFGLAWDYPNHTIPKLHTIRYDPHDRWKPGMKIHYVIYNRTKKRFQFAPVGECVNTQDIVIEYFPYLKTVQTFQSNMDGRMKNADVFINKFWMTPYEIEVFAKNDGFPSVDAFFDYFNEDLQDGWKIIHWTNLEY